MPTRLDPDPVSSPGRRNRPTTGGRIGVVADALGTPLMPWQAHAAEVGGERLPDGRPAYPITVVSVPRQSGKSVLGRAVCVEGMLARTDARVWSTAQTRNAGRDRWLDGARALRRSPSLGNVTDLRLANGSESVSLPNGGVWRPFAPLPDALHGETSTRVLIDEAWAFDKVRGTELIQAIVPTGLTVPEFQLWIVSAAGDESSEFLADLIDAGVAGAATGAGVAAIVWSADTDAHAPDLVERVIDAHPALGHTVTAESIRTAAEVMEPAEFLRAYGNVWTATSGTLFTGTAVDAVRMPATGAPARPPRIALAADVAPDRGSGSIAAAWNLGDGSPDTTAIVAHGPGVAWLVESARNLTGRYGVPLTLDPVGPTAGLADDAHRAGIPLRRLVTRDVTTAAADYLDAVNLGTVGLVTDPALDAALSIATRRSVGRDAWAFDRRAAAGDLSPLVASAHALYALRRPAAEPYLV